MQGDTVVGSQAVFDNDVVFVLLAQGDHLFYRDTVFEQIDYGLAIAHKDGVEGDVEGQWFADDGYFDIDLVYDRIGFGLRARRDGCGRDDYWT